jgi:hypothetical protein
VHSTSTERFMRAAAATPTRVLPAPQGNTMMPDEQQQEQQQHGGNRSKVQLCFKISNSVLKKRDKTFI